MVVLVKSNITSWGKADSTKMTAFYGAIDDRSIIYINGDNNSFGTWVNDFGQGFSFAKGWYNPGSGFDGWTPMPVFGIELKIDTESKNFKWPNWT